jgi:hypothetical protein
MSEDDAIIFEELMHSDFSAHEARRMPLSVINGNKKGK